MLDEIRGIAVRLTTGQAVYFFTGSTKGLGLVGDGKGQGGSDRGNAIRKTVHDIMFDWFTPKTGKKHLWVANGAFLPGERGFLHMHRTPCKANELVSLIFIKKSTGPSRHGKGCCDPLPYLLVSEKFKFAVLGSLENLQPLLCKDSGEDQPPFPLDPLCHQGKSFDQDS